MAAQKYYANIELNQNQIKNVIIETTTVAAANNGALAGRIIFDTVDAVIKYYDGSNWQAVETRFDGQLLYRGAKAHTDTPDSTTELPLEAGDLYVFTSAGTAVNFDNLEVEIGDFAFYDGADWKIIQGNVVLASESNSGLVRLADELGYSEVTTEVDDVATTPADLYTWANQNNKTVERKRVYSTNVTIGPSGETFTHGLGNNPKVTVYNSNGEIINLQVVKGTGTVTISSNSTESSLTVVITA